MAGANVLLFFVFSALTPNTGQSLLALCGMRCKQKQQNIFNFRCFIFGL